MNIKIYTLLYILLVYERELSKNDYLKTLLITIIKGLKKVIKNKIIIMIIIIIINDSCPGHRPWARVINASVFFFLYYVSSARKWINCAIVPLRPCGFRMLNEASRK